MPIYFEIFTDRKRSLGKVICSQASVCPVGKRAWQGGACMAGAMHDRGRGHVWQGGMHGMGGVCGRERECECMAGGLHLGQMANKVHFRTNGQ